MSQHKNNELLIASIVLGVLAVAFVVFQTVPALRLVMYDAYSTVFKQLISDRVLKESSSITSNVPYCDSRSPQQTLDIYTPAHATNERLPLVIFIHGGGWKTGDKANYEVTYYGEPLLRNGISVASLNYRLAPQYTYPSPNNDIACALTYLRTHAEQHHMSTDRWGIFGDSAGAQLGALAMTNPDINAPLKAFVGLYGPYDLGQQINRQSRSDRDAWVYTNRGQHEYEASPVYAAPKKSARYMLYHGSKDRIVPIAQSEQYTEKLRRDGIDVQYVTVQNAGHAFGPRTVPSNQKIREQITRFYLESLR